MVCLPRDDGRSLASRRSYFHSKVLIPTARIYLDMDGELKPSHSDGCDREVSLAKLEKLTLSNSPSVAEKAEDNIGASRGDDGQEGAQVLSLSSKRQSEKEREAVGKLDPRCVCGVR